MQSEANKPSFKNMQGKAAIIAVVALLVIALGVFMFVKPPQQIAVPQNETAAVETAVEQNSGTETAATIDAAKIPSEDAEEMTAEERLAAAKDTEQEAAANAAPADDAANAEGEQADAAPAADATAAADTDAAATAPADDTAARTADAEETESLLSSPKALTVNILRATEDRVIGRADAPVTIIEYASLTCPHCRKFHIEVLPTVKRELVDTGKARIIYRDYPIDNYALKAAMMARCAQTDKYFDLIEVLFQNQDKWIKSDNPLKALAQYGNLAGMDDDFIASCMTNAELESALLKRQQDGRTLYKVMSTPTLIFNLRNAENVRQLVGPEDPRQVTDVVNKLLNMGQ